MSIERPTGGISAGLSNTFFGGSYRLLSKIDRSRLTAAYRVADEVGDDYLLVEFINRSAEASGQSPASWQSGDAPTLQDFFAVLAPLARLRHPNIEPIVQVFEENGTGYAVIDPKPGRILSLDVANEEFFHQAPDILSASNALVDAAEYAHDMGVTRLAVSTDNVKVDDDAVPMISLHKCLDQMLSADEASSDRDGLVYGTAAAAYAMMTGVDVPTHAARQDLISKGEADPFLPVSALDLGYPQGLLALLDKTLQLNGDAPVRDAAAWAADFRAAQTQVVDHSSSAAGGSGKRWISLIGGVAVAGAAAAALVAFTQPDHKGGGVGEAATGIAASPLVTAEPTPPAQVETPGVVEPTSNGEPPTQSAISPTNPSEDTATDPQVPESETAVALVESTNEPAPSTPAQEPTEEPALKSSDVFAMLREIATEDGVAPAAGADEPPSGANDPDAIGDDTLAIGLPGPAPDEAGPRTNDGDIAAITPAAPADDATAPTVPATDGDSLLQEIAAGTTLPIASQPGLGIEWVLTSALSYQVLEHADGGSFLRVRSVQDQFAFVTRNDWFSQSAEVRSVAGVDVSPGFSLTDAIGQHFANDADQAALIDISLSQQGSTDQISARLDIPLEARARIGALDVTQRNVSGSWTLVVRGVPSGQSALSEGDVLVSGPGGDTLKTVSELRRAVQDASARGQSVLRMQVRKQSGQIRSVEVPVSLFRV